MHLVQILLPLHDNEGRLFNRKVFERIRDELTERFGGLTAYSRTPAEGVWKQSSARTNEDQVVVYEVMVDAVDRTWWGEYRQRLEQELAQEQVIIRASPFDLL